MASTGKKKGGGGKVVPGKAKPQPTPGAGRRPVDFAFDPGAVDSSPLAFVQRRMHELDSEDDERID